MDSSILQLLLPSLDRGSASLTLLSVCCLAGYTSDDECTGRHRLILLINAHHSRTDPFLVLQLSLNVLNVMTDYNMHNFCITVQVTRTELHVRAMESLDKLVALV